MDMDEELFSYEEKMEKSCDALNEEYQGIRAGRANPAILNRLRVDYYGVSSTIQQVANVSGHSAFRLDSLRGHSPV